MGGVQGLTGRGTPPEKIQGEESGERVCRRGDSNPYIRPEIPQLSFYCQSVYNKHGFDYLNKYSFIKVAKMVQPTKGERRLVLTTIFLIFCFSKYSGAASQETSQLQKPIQHDVAVTLKLIQVYVTDKKGNPVKDLDKSEFIIYDNSLKVAITDFERHFPKRDSQKKEEAGQEKIVPTAISAESRFSFLPNRYFIFIDFAFNNHKGILRAKEAALHFLDSKINPGDEVGLLSYSMLEGLIIREYLTTNHRKVREAVELTDPKALAGRAMNIDEEYWRRVAEEPPSKRDGAYQKTRSQMEGERRESKSQALVFLETVTNLAKALRYVPGQKNILLFSSGIVSSLIYGNQTGRPQRQIADRDGAHFDPGDYVLRTKNEDMYKELSSSNCSVFSFDTRESAKESSLFAYDDATFEQRNRDIFTRSGGHQDPVAILKDDQITGLYSIRRMSNITGGKYFSNIEDYQNSLAQVQSSTDWFYVLGFSVKEQKDGHFHDIKVELTRKGCEVRAPAGYFSGKPFREYSDLEKRLQLFDLALNERSLSQKPERFPLVSLSYAVGPESRLLTLSNVPRTIIEKFAGREVEIVSLVFDGKDNIADLQRITADPTRFRGADVFIAAGTPLQPGSYKNRIVIRDLETGLAAVAAAPFEIPPTKPAPITIQTPLLLVEEGRSAYFEDAAKNKRNTVSWNEIYPYDRAKYSPAIGEVSAGTQKVFAVIPCAVVDLMLPSLELTASLFNSNSGEKRPVAISLVDRSRVSDLDIFFVEIPLNGIAAGKYVLTFQVEDNETNLKSANSTPLKIGDARPAK